MFLVGLNQELDEVCGKILGRKPLPSMQEVESSALVARGHEPEGEKKKRPWCDHCRRP